MKKKVIVVEDDAVTVMMLKRNLESWGYDVIAVFSRGEDVLEKWESLSPDLFLMDIMLKGESTGIDVVREINSKSDVPVIYLTASEDPHTMERVNGTRYQALVSKPYHPAQVKSIMESVF